jgi:DNA-directed RNA polymerase subunit RPC12/RpoP
MTRGTKTNYKCYRCGKPLSISSVWHKSTAGSGTGQEKCYECDLAGVFARRRK